MEHKLVEVLRFLDDGTPHTTSAVSTAANMGAEETLDYLQAAEAAELVDWGAGDMWELTGEGRTSIILYEEAEELNTIAFPRKRLE